LIAQIELIAAGGEQGCTGGAKPPDESGADQTAMAGDEGSTIVRGWRRHYNP
jgi:hypothetical protein